jgi:hypothetical protein
MILSILPDRLLDCDVMRSAEPRVGWIVEVLYAWVRGKIREDWFGGVVDDEKCSRHR